MKKTIALVLLTMVLIVGCTSPSLQNSNNQPSNKVDLCDQIQTPTGSVNCKSGECSLLVSGDSRVSYQIYEQGDWGIQFNNKIQAGDRITLKSNTLNEVVIIPWDDSSVSKCDNKKTYVYKSEFTGVI